MLHSLRVWNFALLEEVAVEFGSGLNILTGETGAGKSILIDAIGAILGQRISSDMIRSGCDFFRVEAVFSVDERDEMLPLFEEQEIEYDDELIIIRKVSRIGKSSILVNGSHVTLSLSVDNSKVYLLKLTFPNSRTLLVNVACLLVIDLTRASNSLITNGFVK